MNKAFIIPIIAAANIVGANKQSKSTVHTSILFSL